ncbi:WAP four-disulfide core domain protein 5 [Penaeus vannamei]|uniref:Single WAP domain-containing protein isoform 3 n=1 Tax=Penaeus vannamei TaxID=6689 RepID=A0A2S1FLM1_PENVA|nr:single WAP domain-containing protein isoform 3 [Penaeus vannamei]
MVSLKEVLIVSVLVGAVVVSPADAGPMAFDRPGRCRDVGGSGICVIAAANCRGDYDCEYGYKCCPVGCGRECMPIAE